MDCRRSQAKFFDRRTDMRAPLYPTVYPILYIPREILLDSFRLFERFSITFYYSAISGWSNELSNVYFFETQWNIFKSYFSISRLFILVRNELFDVIRYFFETQRNIFRLYFSTFRLFVLVWNELFDVSLFFKIQLYFEVILYFSSFYSVIFGYNGIIRCLFFEIP